MSPMTVFWFVLIAAAVTVFGVLIARQMRGGKETPGMPMDVSTSDHDEPLEDTAKPLDAPRHAKSGLGEAHDYDDIHRTLGGE